MPSQMLSPFPFFPQTLRPTALVVRVLNAVLAREPWAQTRLARYAGRRLSFSLGGLHLPLSIHYDGALQLTEGTDPADVQLSIATERLPEFPKVLAQPHAQPEDLLALVHIQGDAGMANAIAQVVTQLRFDPEAEIARYTGDIIAVRVVAALKQLINSTQRTALHLQANMAEYLGEESGVLVSTDYLSLWGERLQQVEQQLQDVEQRVAGLENRVHAKN